MTHRSLGGREPRFMQTLAEQTEQAREFARRWKEEGRYQKYLGAGEGPRAAVGWMPFDFSKGEAA